MYVYEAIVTSYVNYTQVKNKFKKDKRESDTY